MKKPISLFPKLFAEYNKRFPKQAKIVDQFLDNPEFKKDIHRIRRKFDIPKDGFKYWEDLFDWEKNNVKRNQKEIKIIKREKITLDQDDKPVMESDTGHKAEINIYLFEIFKLLKKHNLHMDWSTSLNTYITTNRPPYTPSQYRGELIRETCNDIILHEQIYLWINATLKHTDLFEKFMGQTNWNNLIVPLQKMMQGYDEKQKRPKRQNDMKQKAFQLFKKNWDNERIFDKLDPLPDDDNSDISEKVSMKIIKHWRREYHLKSS